MRARVIALVLAMESTRVSCAWPPWQKTTTRPRARAKQVSSTTLPTSTSAGSSSAGSLGSSGGSSASLGSFNSGSGWFTTCSSAQVATTLTSATQAGQATLQVANSVGFARNQSIIIDAGKFNQEVGLLRSIGANLKVWTALNFSHGINATVSAQANNPLLSSSSASVASLSVGASASSGFCLQPWQWTLLVLVALCCFACCVAACFIQFCSNRKKQGRKKRSTPGKSSERELAPALLATEPPDLDVSTPVLPALNPLTPMVFAQPMSAPAYTSYTAPFNFVGPGGGSYSAPPGAPPGGYSLPSGYGYGGPPAYGYPTGSVV